MWKEAEEIEGIGDPEAMLASRMSLRMIGNIVNSFVRLFARYTLEGFELEFEVFFFSEIFL
jgi:hypothetical protein